EVRVLTEVGLDDAGNGVPEYPVLCNQEQRTVLDLLQDIGYPVRLMQLDVASALINRGLVAQRTKLLPDLHQIADDRVLRLGTQIEIASIVPATDIEPRDVLAGRKRRIGLRPHRIQIEVLVIRRRL